MIYVDEDMVRCFRCVKCGGCVCKDEVAKRIEGSFKNVICIDCDKID